MAELQSAYWIVLFAMTGFLLWRGTNTMKRTILTILVVGGAAWLLRGLWPGRDYAWAMIAVDSAALVAITWRPAGKWQALTGLSFILQIATHIGRIAAENPDINGYWWGLSIGAFLQLLLVGGWWRHEWLLRHRLRGLAHTAVAHSGHSGVAR